MIIPLYATLRGIGYDDSVNIEERQQNKTAALKGLGMI
jgi:hypothetical protein